MDKFIDIVKVIVIGIVEGISEWLPISSTGHMIILDKWFNISTKFGQEYWSFFLVVIQLGAILAVVVTFFKQLWPFSKSKTDEEKKSIYKTWINIVIGCLPAAILGLFLDDILDKYLYNYITVAITLIVYGVFFVLLEYIFKRKQVGFKVNDIYSLSMKSALIIGLAQVLALIPGTSRSGVTILAGMLIGCSREVSTKYSFFLSIPVMLGASLLKGVKFAVSGETITSFEIILLVIVAVIFIAPLAMYNGLGEDDGYFGGADGAAGEAIEETGYEPWFSSIWEPPSGEIESLLFALQAAIGALIIGYFFGYWRGKSKRE